MKVPADAFVLTELATVPDGSVFMLGGHWFYKPSTFASFGLMVVHLTSDQAGRVVQGRKQEAVLTLAEGWRCVPVLEDPTALTREGPAYGALAITPMGPAFWGSTGSAEQSWFFHWATGGRLTQLESDGSAAAYRYHKWSGHLVKEGQPTELGFHLFDVDRGGA